MWIRAQPDQPNPRKKQGHRMTSLYTQNSSGGEEPLKIIQVQSPCSSRTPQSPSLRIVPFLRHRRGTLTTTFLKNCSHTRATTSSAHHRHGGTLKTAEFYRDSLSK